MEVEKKRSKGGFFHLFDWNGKSRKKLFATNSEPPRELNPGQLIGSTRKLLPQMIEVDTYKSNFSYRRSGDLESSSSSVTSDDGNGKRAPGVVAKLMGLDSLPVPDVSDPCYEPHFVSASYHERNVPNTWTESQPKDYSHIANKFERISPDSVRSGLHRVNRPIERFQTEVLPPKSAKSVPVTHHGLLSPVRSPGVITLKNADYIMEAAARIIDASPQTNRAASWSSSVPLRIRGLKEKMEAAHKASRPQRPEERISDKFDRGHSNKFSSGGSYCTPAFGLSSEFTKVGDSMSKAKSVSLATQEKVNLQKKGETTSSGNSNSSSPIGNDIKAKRSSKSQADVKRTIDKGTAVNRANNVLKQNNQKQNSTSNKDSSLSKSPRFDQQTRNKPPIVTCHSTAADKGSVKSEHWSKKSGPVTAELKKTAPSSKRNRLPGKKQYLNGDLKSRGSAPDASNSHVKQLSKRYVSADQRSMPVDEKMKEGTDVVSFTFTAPMFRPVPDPESSGRNIERNCTFISDSSSDTDQSIMRSSALASSGFKLVGGDALSILLEQKLRELSSKIESSGCNVVREMESSPNLENTLQASVPAPSTVLASEECATGFQLDSQINKACSSDHHDCSSVDNLELLRNSGNQFQLSEMEEDHSTMNSSSDAEFLCQHPATLNSVPEPTGGNASCLKSENGSDGVMLLRLSPTQEQETISPEPTNALSADGPEKTACPTSFTGSSEWQFDYIKSTLSDANLMLTEFALGETDNVISSALFDESESGETTGERDEEEPWRFCKRLLFDSLTESLNLRCSELFVGTMKGWGKVGMFLEEKREWLVEELFKEIDGWKGMGEMMVDELVEKDMSKQLGRWLDFDVEAFEEGVDIENVILTSLVDELVSDLLLL